MPKPLSAPRLTKLILNAATAHGEDEPEHEVGDLQQALAAAISLLTPAQRGALRDHPSVVDFVDFGVGS